jgi:low temperature requirement protein LtrA
MSRAVEAWQVEEPEAAPGVTTLELFFDLVFVFTVTQLTSLVGEAHTPRAYAQAGMLLFVIWWMYDGYCYLTNNVGPTSTSTRLPMLGAMGAFLVLAIAVPGAYGEDALLFAVTYTVIVLVHLFSFFRSTVGGSAKGILRVAPINLAACALLLVAVALPEDDRWMAWAAAMLVYVGSMVGRRESGVTIRPEHFAERHRLLLIIALGESVIAVGVSAQGHISEARFLGAVLLAMVLLALFWWVHFTEDARADEALLRIEREEPGRLIRVALLAFSMAYLVLIAGLILVAAGLHEVVHDPAHHLTWQASWMLAAGVATYLFGNSVHLWLLGLSSGWALKFGAMAALATVLLGHGVNGAAQTAALCVVILVALLATARVQARAREPRNHA